MAEPLDWSTADATVTVTPRDGKHTISVKPRRPDFPVSTRTWTTAYPLDLIQEILRVKGPSHVCDEIARDENPSYVRRSIEAELFAYYRQQDLDGKRILDFGCGSGASTVLLARMFPHSQIAGIDFMGDYLAIGRRRAAFYGLDNVQFFQSEASGLPSGMGTFDLIILSAVYEHLLPGERRTVLPAVWSLLKPGGALFINQTPYRYFPIELHTTGIPLLNYLPDGLAMRVARRFSKRIAADESWESMLRRGIRGGSKSEIRRLLGQDAQVRKPITGGDEIDVWYAQLRQRMMPVKAAVRAAIKLVHAVTGAAVLPHMCVVLEKRAQ